MIVKNNETLLYGMNLEYPLEFTNHSGYDIDVSVVITKETMRFEVIGLDMKYKYEEPKLRCSLCEDCNIPDLIDRSWEE